MLGKYASRISGKQRRKNRRLRAERLEDRRLLAADYEIEVQVVQVCDDAGSTCTPLGPSDTSTAAPNEYLYEAQINEIWDQAAVQINFSIVTWNNSAALQLTSAEMSSLFSDSWSGGGTAPPSPIDGLQYFFVLDHPGTGYTGSPTSGWVANPLSNPAFQARNAGISQVGIMDPVFATTGRGVMTNEGFVSDSLSGTFAHEIGHGLGLRHMNDPDSFGTTNDPILNLPTTTANLMWEAGAGPSYDSGQSLAANFDLLPAQIDAVLANGQSTNFDPDGNGEGPLKPISNALVVTVLDDELDSTSPTATLADMGGAADLSLREAIALANQNADADVINFNISGSGDQVISLTSPLPALSTVITLDATTQTGYVDQPVVGIDGAGAGSLADGLKISADGVTVRGLAIYNFDRDGIEITGDSATIEQNHLGVNLSEVAAGNFIGVKIVGSQLHTIGSNVISGNERSGIFASSAATGGSVIVSNMIGTNAAGTAAIANGTDGLTLYAPNNTVGRAGEGNVISGNARSGVYLFTAGRGGNTVHDNMIGISANGTAAIPNLYGLHVRNENNTLGGSGTNEGNVISGNNSHGVILSQADASGNTVRGNQIGTNEAGTAAVSNFDGLQVIAAPNNTIGGPGSDDGNLISGNVQRGVTVVFSGATGNNFQGNQIGTDTTGNSAIANVKGGMRLVRGASNNTIQNNQISGNDFTGITIDNVDTTNNDILFNQIGVNAAGTSPLHNGSRGALRILSPQTTIQGNAISDGAFGVIAFRDATDLVITQNSIGGVGLGIPTGIRLITGANDASITVNQITNNTTAVSITNAQRVTIQNNSIANNGFGIDLNADGSTSNDAGDTDGGANGLQNSPVISTASFNGSTLSLTYQVDTIDSGSNYPMTIEFFVDDGNGQGETRIAVDNYAAANASSNRSVNISTSSVQVGDFLVATATDALGNTSEFSVRVEITS